MLVPYEELTSQAKVLIYPGSRKFFPTEFPEIQEELRKFCQELDGIDICFKLEYDRFIVFIISEETPLLNMDEETRGIVIIGFKSLIESFEEII